MGARSVKGSRRNIVAAALNSILCECKLESIAQFLLTLGCEANRPGDASLDEPAQRDHPGTQCRSQSSGEMRTALGEIEALQRELSFFQFRLPPIDSQFIQPFVTAGGDFKDLSFPTDHFLAFEGSRDLHTQFPGKMVVTSAGKCERIERGPPNVLECASW